MSHFKTRKSGYMKVFKYFEMVLLSQLIFMLMKKLPLISFLNYILNNNIMSTTMGIFPQICVFKNWNRPQCNSKVGIYDYILFLDNYSTVVACGNSSYTLKMNFSREDIFQAVIPTIIRKLRRKEKQ